MVVMQMSGTQFHAWTVGLARSLTLIGLVNPPDQATHVAGATLDLMLVSSHCPCSLMVHSVSLCCAQTLGCCPVVICCADLTSSHCPVLVVISVLGLARCSLSSSKAPLLVDTHAVWMLLTSSVTNCCPCYRGILHASAPPLDVDSVLVAPMNVSRASPEMVHGIQLPTCTLASGRLVWHSIAHIVLPIVLSGHRGNHVSVHSLSLSPDWPLPSVPALSVAQQTRVATSQIK